MVLEYDVQEENRPTRRHRNADALARLPINAIQFANPDSLLDLRAEHIADSDIRPLCMFLDSGPATFLSLETASKKFRKMKAQVAELKFRSGVLVRETQTCDQIVIPHYRL